jgi:hypothetical protein
VSQENVRTLKDNEIMPRKKIIEQKKNPPGRPKKVIQTKQVMELASIGCTMQEMAGILDCSEKTLQRRFVHVIKKGMEQFKKSLRRMQYDSAKHGSQTMLIWLGKQYLGQKDKVENEITGKDGQAIKFEGISNEQIKRMAEELIRSNPNGTGDQGK